ncbi:MAG: hypothetical protein ABEJ92_05470 [Halobacteriales archaeon]
MNRVFGTGLALTGVGLGGYLLGLVQSYPGRAFSLTALMVGIALVAMRRAFDGTEVDR